MAARLNINHSVLSRLKYKRGAGLSDETLVNIIAHLDTGADEQARFLASYLRDRIVGPDDVRTRIRITVEESARLQECSISEISAAARRLENAASRNDRVRDALLSLSNLAATLTA